MSGKTVSAPSTCGAQMEVPRAVVKARVLLNSQMEVKIDDIIGVVHDIFENGACPICGLGGWPTDPNDPQPWDPGTITEVAFERAFLPEGQLAAVVFTEAGPRL